LNDKILEKKPAFLKEEENSGRNIYGPSNDLSTGDGRVCA
jgi:hypothetical protein